MKVVVLVLVLIQGLDALGPLEMISNYAKVVKNEKKPSTETIQQKSIATTLPYESTTDPVPEYEDFDDLQEDRSLKESSNTQTMMKYFNGLVSLLALMYKFNGNFGGYKQSGVKTKNQNEPRNEKESTGKYFKEAQDRFEFPQKKFRYHQKDNDDTMDQQFQPVENYPPYNPLQANSAETYNQDDKKSSYDSDIMQYDLTKNSISDYNSNVDIQQSYSYEIPYEAPKQSKTPTYDLTNDVVSWNNDRPVYHPWMSKPVESKPEDQSFYQPWKTEKPSQDFQNPWKSKTPEIKPTGGDSDLRQSSWNDKPSDFPIYHHEPPTEDHHFEFHEVDHPMDEDRVSKKPYSYYFLGRKLWYIPLLFSVYFIIYVGALVLKSVARHKIQFPEKIWNLHDDHFGHAKHRRHRKIDDITENYENAIEKIKNKFM